MRVSGNEPLVNEILAALEADWIQAHGYGFSIVQRDRLREMLEAKIDAHCKACAIEGD